MVYKYIYERAYYNREQISHNIQVYTTWQWIIILL